MFINRSIKKLIRSISYNYAIVADTISYRNRIVSYTGHNDKDIPIYISTRLVKWYTKLGEDIPVGIALLNKYGNPVILINTACENYIYKDVIIKHELGHIKRGHLTSYTELSKADRELHADTYAVNTLGYSKVLNWLLDYKTRLAEYPETKNIIDCRIRNLNKLYGTSFSVSKRL